MIITQNDFNDIIKYVKKIILQQQDPDSTTIHKTAILALDELVTLPDMLTDLNQKKERSKPQENSIDNGFKKIWDTYPSTPNFRYKGMDFKNSSRVLRSNYQVCEGLFLRSLAIHKTSPEDILKALEKQLKLSKEESFNEGVNKLNYWSSLEVWLRQARWEAFVSEGDDDETSSESQETSESGNNSQNYG